MPTLELVCKYKKNTGAVLSPNELRDLYLYGINLKSRDGSELPVYVWEQKIKAAQEQVEKFLAIKLIRQLVSESLTYYRDDYLNNLPILNCSLPVNKPITLMGLLNNTEQLKYPIEWSNYYQDSDEIATRRINIVPSGTAIGVSTSVILMGVTAQLGIRSLNMVPNYWYVQYISGWKPGKLPIDILDVVGKLASVQILAIMGDLVLAPGLSGQSLSIDGLSQSLNTVISSKGGAFSGRISQYLQDIKDTLERLKRNYTGINFAVL
jgi:hypothetical protein